ncbi:uncharacterized protein VP01_139g7 [Puccinia sorghi]|uniref:Uncharacterized protein n=1 Tax=Puccinia sorghi TaxID=27349 RepID=A0A0L6VL03_9BASI|nr:uncharacterized protein VP01_139g7 [Puccinia sorghi]
MPKKAAPKPMKPTTKKPAIRRKSKKNRGNNSSEDDAADKTVVHLNKEDYLLLWKREGSCCCLSAKGEINGFEVMATNLRNQSPSNINLKPHQMNDLFHKYKDKYKKSTPNPYPAHVSPLSCNERVDAQADNETATSSPSEPAGNEIGSSDMESKNDYVCISTSS